jgi:hypothetical protein
MTTYLCIHLGLIAFTYVLCINLSRLKGYKSDIAKYTALYQPLLDKNHFYTSLFAPISTVVLLLDIVYFVIFETKENYDAGVTKYMIEDYGKEDTRRRLNTFFDVMPHYIEKQLK